MQISCVFGIIICEIMLGGIFKMNFLSNLELLLKNKNMTRADLARALNVAPSTINSWYARGSENISIKNIKQIAAYFSISLESLVNGNINTLYFSEKEYTKKELKLIADFGQLIKESRRAND